jgi:hypothetical protein
MANEQKMRINIHNKMGHLSCDAFFYYLHVNWRSNGVERFNWRSEYFWS